MMRWLRTIWYVLSLRCEEAERLRVKAGDGQLSRAERLGGRLHEVACRSCRTARRQAKVLDRGIRHLRTSFDAEPAVGQGLPEDARERIRAAMRDADQENSI